MIRRLALLMTMVLGAATAAAQAAEIGGIAAVVNDEAVTMHEVEMRTRIALLSSQLPDSLEVRRRVVPQVIRKLIDERLQTQEARRLKIAVGEDDISRGIASIEEQNRMRPGSLEPGLRGAGIDASMLRRQVEAEIGWLKVVRTNLLPTIKISNEEIELRLEQVRAGAGQPEYLLAEIVLPVDAAENETEVRKLAERILQQAGGGIPFAALAHQFSQSPSAAAGGDLGWLSESMLDPDLAATIRELEPGRMSPPVRTASAYHIVMLRDRRIAGRGNPDAVQLALAQLFIPAQDGAQRQAATARIVEIAGAARSCADFDEAAKRHSLTQSGRMGAVSAGDLPPSLKTGLLRLKTMEKTPPIQGPEGVRVVMLCGRTDPPGDSLPNSDDIRQRLEAERLDLLARRHLRNLRRSAFIENRL